MSPGNPLRVLVVDDNRDAADSLALLLRLLGHQAVAVYDGPAALESARAVPPDVAMLDLGMPGMTGYDLATQLRALPGLEKVTLVAVSGYAGEADRQRAGGAGFSHYLLKPTPVSDLRAVFQAIAGTRPGNNADPLP